MKKSLKLELFLITLFFTSCVVPHCVGLNGLNKVKAEELEAPVAGITTIINDYYEEQGIFRDGKDTYIIQNDPIYKVYDVPEYSGFKSWMPYNLFGKKTNQYKLQQIAHTGEYGIRYVDEYACIAVGSFADTKIGQRIDLVLENGTIIECVMADQKADKHTDKNNIITVHSDCCSEFIVDKETLDKTAKRSGNMSSICEEWDSPVVQFYIYEENVLENVTEDTLG